jgi:hypothetical protein
MAGSQTIKFCSCIKQVAARIKPIRGSREGAAIAICTKSMLQSKGRTLKRIKCKGKNAKLETQRLRRRRN